MARMEDEHSFYEYDMNTDEELHWDDKNGYHYKLGPKYGEIYVKGDFPEAGAVPRDFLHAQYAANYKRMKKAQEVLHMKQFDKAFKLPAPPSIRIPPHAPWDKYWSPLDQNTNHPLEGPS